MSIRRKRIALFVETSLGSGREILRGIARCAHEKGDWQLLHAARGLEDELPEWIKEWDGDGIIARIQTPKMARHLKELNIPIVDVLGVCPGDFPLVHVNDQLIAALVADHFRERDFQHLAFYGISGENWSERRCAFFKGNFPEAESFHVLDTQRSAAEGTGEGIEKLRSWLRDLPKPAAVMVCSDQRGLSLLEACLAEGISVPEELAVVGVDNDLALCEISAPPLSSVRGGHVRVGFEAAQLMDRLIEGADAPSEPLLVPPTGIVPRESSKMHAIDDPVVARGIRYLRDRLSESITNDEVARFVGVSRTLFQQRFRKATGQTIREFILKERLEKAVAFIERSDMPFAEIAHRTGFRHQEYLGYVIKKRVGKTPGQLRKAASDK